MADGFNLDPEKIKMWSQEAKLIETTMGGVKKYSEDVNRIIEDITKASAEMSRYGKLLGVDKEMTADMDAVYKSLVQMGVPAEKLLHLREKEGNVLKELAEAQRELYDKESKRVMIGRAIGKASGKALDSFNKTTKAVGQQVAGMGKLQLSLIGIIAKIVEVYNLTGRLSGAGEQAAGQWGVYNRGAANAKALIGQNTDLMSKYTSEFGMTLDESKEFVTSLAMAGMEQKDMVVTDKQRADVGSQMLAIQSLQKRSVAEQMPYVQGLVANFNKTATEANRFGTIVTQLTKDIPGLTMSEAMEDMAGLADNTKIFNMSLLDTLSLYNTIIRKGEIWGKTIGSAPRAVQKEIAKTITGWGLNLDPGMKAWLGEGETPSERVFEFEETFAKNLPEIIKRAITKTKESTSGLSPTDQALAIRSFLQSNLAFRSKEAAMTMEKSITGGELTPEKIDALANELAEQRKAAQAAADEYDANLKELVKHGAGLAKKMITLEQRIANWIDQKLIKPVSKLTKALGDLTDAFKESWMYKGIRIGETGDIVSGAISKHKRGNKAYYEGQRLEKELKSGVKLDTEQLLLLRGEESGLEREGKTEFKAKMRGIFDVDSIERAIFRAVTQGSSMKEHLSSIGVSAKSGQMGQRMKHILHDPILEIGKRGILAALSPDDIQQLSTMIESNATTKITNFLVAQLGEAKAQNLIRQYSPTGLIDVKKPPAPRVKQSESTGRGPGML